MIVSEDGYVTGSVDVSKLDEVEAKSDEAKARLDTLKAEAKASQEQSAAAADRMAELHKAQSVEGQKREAVTTQAFRYDGPAVDAKPADQGAAKPADQGAEAKQAEETKQLQAEAEAAGVTVDKRWGPDRLRQEIDAAKARKR